MSTNRQVIEQELKALWRSEQQGGDTPHSAQRNYTLNLVAFAPNAAAHHEADAVLKELPPIHPGRYIMLCQAPDTATAKLHHHVASHCLFDPGRNKRICCDLITLEAKDGLLEELYGLTLSLLISDLPVEFWWLGDLPLNNPFFHTIADDSDRVWVDSSKFHDPPQAMAMLAATWAHAFPNTVLADLNWVRIQRWRHLIADLFDGEWTPYLWQIRELTIEYAEGRPPTRAFMLACWMAAQLGWRYQGEPLTAFPEQLEFTGKHGPVTVAIKPVAVVDRERDRLYAVRVRTTGEHQGLFSVARERDPQCVLATSEIDGQAAFSRVLCFEHLEAVQLLSEGLRGWGRDPGWEGALAVMRTMMRGMEQVAGTGVLAGDDPRTSA